MSLDAFNNPCNDSFYIRLQDRVSFGVYYVLTPCYFVLGLLGQTLSLLAYFRRAKSESAYIFQILVTISSLLTVFFTTLYVATFVWAPGGVVPGARWYMTCYACMWFTAHLSMVPMNAVGYTTQLLSTCMAYDRFQSLRKQQQYKETTKKQYAVLTLGCFALGVAMAGYAFFIWDVSPDASNGYTIVTNPFIFDIGNIIWVLVRNAVVAVALIALYFFNIGIPYLYYKNMKMIKSTMTSALEQKRKSAARMLIMLSLSECLLITVGNTVAIAFYILVAISPPCLQVTLFATAMDGIMELTSMLNFYLMFVLNRKYRRMILSMLRGWCHWLKGGGHSSTAVSPASQQQQQQPHLDALRTPRVSHAYLGIAPGQAPASWMTGH